MEKTLTLTSIQAAVELGVSEREVRRRAEKGEIERFRQGKKYLYRVLSTKSAEVDNPIVLRDSLLTARARLRELEQVHQDDKRAKFRWQLAAIAAIITVMILAGGISLGYGLFVGGRGELLQARQLIQSQQQRADDLQRRNDKLMDEIIQMIERDRSDDIMI